MQTVFTTEDKNTNISIFRINIFFHKTFLFKVTLIFKAQSFSGVYFVHPVLIIITTLYE